MTCTLYDEFAGFGGSSQGAAAVPGVELMLAANHKGRPALDGVVENVVQVRKLDEFVRWRREIEAEDRTRLVALIDMLGPDRTSQNVGAGR